MGMLQDKTYEEMDFINKLVEPYDLLILKAMEGVPNEIDLDPKWLTPGRVDYRDAFKEVLANIHPEMPEWVHNIAAFFIIPVSCNIEGEPKFDLVSKKVVDGRVFMSVGTLPKPDNSLLTREVSVMMDRFSLSMENIRPKEMSEVLEIFGVKSGKRKKTWWNLKDVIYNVLREDKWKIRSDKVAYDIVRWCHLYITTSNYSAYASLLNVKCMVHRGNPIYSAEEV